MMRMDRRGGGNDKSEASKKRALYDSSDQQILQKLKRSKIDTSKGNRSAAIKTPAKSETIDGTAKVVSTKGFYRKKKELKEEKIMRRQKRQLTKELTELEWEVKRMKKKDTRKVEKRSQSKKEKRLEEIPWEERSQYKARRRAIRRNKKVTAKEVPQNQSQSSKPPPPTVSKRSTTSVEQPEKAPEKKVKLILAPPEPPWDDSTVGTDVSSTTKDGINDDATKVLDKSSTTSGISKDDITDQSATKGGLKDDITDRSSTTKGDLKDDVTNTSSTAKDGINDDTTVKSTNTLKVEAPGDLRIDVTEAPKKVLEKKEIKDPRPPKEGKPNATQTQILSVEVKKVVLTTEQSSVEMPSPLLKIDFDSLPSIKAPSSDRNWNLASLLPKDSGEKGGGGNKKSNVKACSVEPGPTIPMASPSIKQWAPSPTVSECLSPFYDAIRRQARKRRRRAPSPSCESVWSFSSMVDPEKFKKLSQNKQRVPPQSYTVDEIRSMMVEGGGTFGSNIKRATLDFRKPKRAFLKDYEKFLAPAYTQVLQQDGKVVEVVDLTCYKVKRNTPPKV